MAIFHPLWLREEEREQKKEKKEEEEGKGCEIKVCMHSLASTRVPAHGERRDPLGVTTSLTLDQRVHLR